MRERQIEARCVLPQLLETVVGAFVRVENVDDHIGVIRDHPLARREAIDRVRLHAVLLAQPVLQIVQDRFQMRFARAGADHEKIGEAGQLAQIERDDVLGFFVRGDGRAELG